jgi:hypothetical protein
MYAGAAKQLTMHACGRCGGIWLDLEGHKRVLERVSDEVLDLAVNATARGTEPVELGAVIPCPVCQRSMRGARFAHSDIER